MTFEDDNLYKVSTRYEGQVLSLFELAIWKNGLAFRSIDFSESGLPVIKIAELNNGISESTRYTNAKYSKDVFLTKGDMVFSWSGNPDTSIDVYRYTLPDGWLNQHIFKVTPNQKLVDKDYLFYLLKYLKSRFKKIARNKQTTGLGHVTIADIKKMQLVLPQKESQIKIGRILRSLDDKIESNNRANNILQQQAQAIYCELKNGEFNACLGDLIAEMPKSKIKVSDVKEAKGDYPFFTSGKAVLNYYTALVSGRKIYLNTGGNADVKCYIGDASYSTDTWCIEGKNGLTDFLYLALCDYLPEIEQICFEGSALRHLQKAKLKSLPVHIPLADANIPFFCAIKSLFDRQSANVQENKKLATLRDTLLPKLMSGEIDVSNVKI